LKKLIIILLLYTAYAFPQELSINGVIHDSTGAPLPGVNVSIMSTSLGAAADAKGRFSIKGLNQGNYTLEFSSIGYKTKIIRDLVLKDKPIVLKVILQQQPLESDQVVTSASKYAKKISDLPVSAEVLGPGELEKKNITNLEDAMRYVPGVNMIDDQVSIRGSSGYSRGAGTRVMLTIDGIPYYTGDTGEIIWEIIPVPEIQRVEVIKGAASSLYGSSAIGGVVNVVTKEITSSPVTYVKTSIGAYDKPAYSIWDWSSELRTYSGLTVAHSDKIGEFGYALSLTRLSDMSYRQSGFYSRYIGFFKGSYDFSASSSLTLLANSLNQHSGNFLYWKDSRNVLVPLDADQGETVTSNRYMFGAVYKDILSSKLFYNIRASYYKNDWSDQTSSHNNSISDLFRLELQANAAVTDDLVLVSGIEATHDNVNSNIFSTQSAYGFGVYSQADYNVYSPLSLTFGARYDYSKLSSKIGVNAFSPKAGANFHLSDKLILRTSFGTGFRAPTLSEAFTSTTAGGITIKPNPGLRPETNWTFEAGVNYQAINIPYGNLNLVEFDAALFQNEFYDFIEPTIDPTDGLIYFSNITRARIQGFELNSNYSFLENKIKLTINYTYLWARDLQLHQALKYRPRHMANASLDYYISNFNFGADFRFSSKVEQMDYELVTLGVVKDGTLRADIKVLDLRAGYDLKSLGIPAKIFFNANNVFNYNYVELIANLAPIRNYSLSAEFLF
jgi:outer membrane receptor for ferrienterochelin and colicins